MMRNFTKLMLTLALLVAGLSGANAGKYYATISTEFYCAASWNSGNNQMSWKGVWTPPSGAWGSFYFVNTGLPSGDITPYTKFHATLSDFSDNVDHVWLRIKQGDGNYADAKLFVGENNIDLVALAAANPGVDFTKIDDVTIWGAREALDGKTIDEDHPASVVLANVYMFSPTLTVKAVTGFGDEITSLGNITDGTKFVVSDGTNVLYFSGNQDAKSDGVAKVPADSYYYYTLSNIAGLDLDENGIEDDDIYAINIINEEGNAFPAPYGLGNNVNFTNGGGIFSGSAQADKAKGYGTDAQYQGIWKVAYSDGNGFTFKNCSLNKYLKVNGSQEDVCYMKLYKSLVVDTKVIADFDKQDNAANDKIFALANATGYNAETGETTDPAWTFGSPVDISDWDYLVITTVNNASDIGGAVTITDDNGVSVGGEGYSGATAGTGGNMWIDRWNNQNAIRISIDYLRINKSLDITKIKSLSIGGTTKIANVYLTDYNNTKIAGGYCQGDVKREYNVTDKFGTICLPYVASYSGAEVFNIASGDASGISLSKVTGLLEAGKPYFYISADGRGQNGDGSVCNVNFFRADLAKFDALSPVANNGLVGTFDDTTAPNDSYVLSNNKLHKVNSTVNVAANKAYVDLTQIGGGAPARGDAFIGFDETTGIKSVNGVEITANGEIFNLNGQRVNNVQKGLYIMNGKKVIVK